MMWMCCRDGLTELYALCDPSTVGNRTELCQECGHQKVDNSLILAKLHNKKLQSNGRLCDTIHTLCIFS